MEEIMVSVVCTVYNHEKYLRKCLDGFVMQKTTFPFEVIIHDDASTDHSADIIREYEKQYPHIFRPIYQTVNQYSQHIPFFVTAMMPMVRGKYMAQCEGDDYWCDEHKLQRQFDAMEANPNCRLCVHRVKRINEAGGDTGNFYPYFHLESGVIPRDTFMPMTISDYQFHTTSYFYRTEDMKACISKPQKFQIAADVGDIPTLLYFGNLGDTFYIDEPMTCYRESSIGGWNETMKKDQNRMEKHIRCMIQMYTLFDEYSGYRYTQAVQKRNLMFEIKQKNPTLTEKTFWRYLLNRENRRQVLAVCGVKEVLFSLGEIHFPGLIRAYEKVKGNQR